MDRLTIKSEILDGRYGLKCLCSDTVPEYKGSCRDCCEINADCEFCGICEAIDRLAAYEDTGLTPEEVTSMKAEYSDTFQAHLRQLCDIKDKRIAELEAENAELHKLIDATQKILWSGWDEDEDNAAPD